MQSHLSAIPDHRRAQGRMYDLAHLPLFSHGLDYIGEFIVTQRAINKALKRALDPNNILAPGKSGIDLRS